VNAEFISKNVDIEFYNNADSFENYKDLYKQLLNQDSPLRPSRPLT